MTSIEFRDASAGIYDGDQWISWHYIHQQLAKQNCEVQQPKQQAGPGKKKSARERLPRLVKRLLHDAKMYHRATGHHLPIYGELGELYAELRFGIVRHKPCAQGSDGRIGNDLVEIKTIGPLSKKLSVRVKRAGNFSKLAVVRISPDFTIDARLVDRNILHKGTGTFATVAWPRVIAATEEDQARDL